MFYYLRRIFFWKNLYALKPKEQLMVSKFYCLCLCVVFIVLSEYLKAFPKHFKWCSNLYICYGDWRSNTKRAEDQAFTVMVLVSHLSLSWRRSLSYRNQSIDLLCKSMDWFLYNRDLHHERVKNLQTLNSFVILLILNHK